LPPDWGRKSGVTGATATSLSSIFELSAEPKRESLVVSVHDVAPATRVRVEEIVAELAHHGVLVCSLLVVPNYHHRGCFTEDRAFVRWLQELEAKGHEIVIHGYFHERPARNGENLPERFFTRLYTKGEGEFYDLDYDEAFRRISPGDYCARMAAEPAGRASGGGRGNGIHDAANGRARFAIW
jgi:hypothetical protein